MSLKEYMAVIFVLCPEKEDNSCRDIGVTNPGSLDDLQKVGLVTK